jgi:hypothetical protein
MIAPVIPRLRTPKNKVVAANSPGLFQRKLKTLTPKSSLAFV